jgi:hypothetical protein
MPQKYLELDIESINVSSLQAFRGPLWIFPTVGSE